MRFASLQGNSANAYANAGKQVVNSSENIFATQRKTGPDYGKLSIVAMKTAADEKIAAMKAEMDVVNAGIKAHANVTKEAIRQGAYKEGRKIDSKLRKAGSIAAIGTIAGGAYLAASDPEKGREYPNSKGARDKAMEDYKNTIDGIHSRREASDSEAFNNLTSLLSSGDTDTSTGTSTDTVTDTSSDTSGGSTPGKADGGSSGAPLNGKLFNMDSLSKKDYDDLAYAVSSEAALGTDDEYGVAANILTRLQSGKYGDSVHSIIHAPGQYEGVYKGMSRHSPEISARLQSPEGRKKIQQFITQLDGRTEFKGQSQLGNRVASEDPMFHPKGNFYHYSWQ